MSNEAGVVSKLTLGLADRYRIEREIGAGGMATVYLARDIRHNRNVALKVLNPELGAVLGAERFLAEIQVTANLQHPATSYSRWKGDRLRQREQPVTTGAHSSDESREQRLETGKLCF